MIKNNKPLSIRNDQRGLVSFIVTLLLIIVVSLIVLGFARITRREQRQALDRQLSTAAYYAAESGVNDARDYIQKTIASTGLGSVAAKNDCGPISATYPQQLSPSVSYSCLLIDPFPTSLGFKPVTTQESKIFPVASEGGTPINEIKFYWQDSDGGNNLSGCGLTSDLPVAWHSGCDTGMLRVDLVPINSVARNDLLAGAMTVFFYPQGGIMAPGTVNESIIKGLPNQGRIVKGRCDSAGPQQCAGTITGLTDSRYYARVKAIYQNANVTVKARNTTIVGDLRLVGAQAIVDSTGKASDVVRRIQVNVPLVSPGLVPESVLDSIDTICKRFYVLSTAVAELPDDACQLN